MAFKFNEYNLGGTGLDAVLEKLKVTENGTYTPAEGVDGWNEVTVAVAGGTGGGDNTVIDVTELPTENVDDSKIYRITQTGEGGIYFAMLDGATPMILTVAEVYQLFSGRLFEFPIHEVDTLPDTMEKPDGATLTFPLYVLKSTGVAYFTNDGTSATAIPINVAFELGEYSGYAPSADAIVATATPTWYTVRGGEVFTYGLPNTSDNKTFYEYTNGSWDECDSGERLMVDVKSLPTENIADNRVYRQVKRADKESVCLYIVTNDGRSGELKDIILEDLIAMGILSASYGFYTEYYLVDALPETANDNQGYSNKLEIHIVRSTMEPYVYYNSKWMTFSERMRWRYGDTLTYGEFEGGIRYVGEAIDVGYYTLFVPAGTEYVYGVPNADSNKTVYQYSDGWVNLSTMKATTDKLLLQRDGLTELVNEYEPHANFAKIAEFVVSNGNVTVLSNSPDADIETIAIPNGINTLANDAFISHRNLKKVILPESMNSIGSRSFFSCENLERINLPNGITSIGSQTFSYCRKLREINIPVSVTDIGIEAFFNGAVSRFNYEGTKAQWKAVTLRDRWSDANYTVYCSDGTISYDGTET